MTGGAKHPFNIKELNQQQGELWSPYLQDNQQPETAGSGLSFRVGAAGKAKIESQQN